jgi:hypothetical protein
MKEIVDCNLCVIVEHSFLISISYYAYIGFNDLKHMHILVISRMISYGEDACQ